jgi:hypothetical protein
MQFVIRKTCKTRMGSQQPDDGLCEVDAETGAITKIWNPVFNDYGYGIKQAAEAKSALLLKFSSERQVDLLRHHKSNNRNAQAFDTTIYGRREKFCGEILPQTLFVARKRLLDLKVSHLDPRGTGGFIFSQLLREHIAKEWKAFLPRYFFRLSLPVPIRLNCLKNLSHLKSLS